MSKEKEQSSNNPQIPKPSTTTQRPNTTSRLQTFSKQEQGGNKTKKKE